MPIGSMATYCCEECRPSAYKAKSTSELTCCECGTAYYYEKGASSLTRCGSCHAEHKRQIKREASRYGKTLNARGRHYTAESGAAYEPLNPMIIFERDGWECYLCGEDLLYDGGQGSPLYPTVDHMTPLSRGGDHTYENTRACCHACNSKKGAMTLEEVTCCA